MIRDHTAPGHNVKGTMEDNLILQGRYQIIRKIGQGGMGKVYLAKDLRLGSQLALKENMFNDIKMVEAFEREARLLAGLRHAALPKVFDHFAEGDSTFLVMEFIAGNDLEDVLEKRRMKQPPIGVPKPFEVEEVITWGEQLLDALDYLHTRSTPIIHRDIKPQNLKLAERNQIALLDFGLAKGSAAQATQMVSNASIFGYTPNYAPIEQVQGSGTDARSDLYSLAATLYHLITGEVPPDALTRAKAMVEGDEDPLRPANLVNPRVPASVAVILTQAMAQNKNARPASAKEMHKMLSEAKRSLGSSINPTVQVSTPMSGSPAIPQNSQGAFPQNSQGSFSSTSQTSEPQNRYPSQPQQHPSYPQAPPNPSYPQAQQTAVPQNYGQTNFPQSHTYSNPPRETVQDPYASRYNSQPPPMPAPSYVSQVAPAKKGSGGKIIAIIGAILLIGAIAVAAIILATKDDDNPKPTANGNTSGTNKQANSGKNQLPANIIDDDTVKHLISSQNFIPIKPGQFTMGTEEHGDNNDVPHVVRITHPYDMGKYEVTQQEWQAVMGNNPSKFQGSDLPVENVSWDDVQQFIQRLNELKDGYHYRLPTEAEWEYASRAGDEAEYISNLENFAWIGDNSGLQRIDSEDIYTNDKDNYNKRLIANGCQTHRVGQKKPNKWGLYDMLGNVWEWCSDWYSETYYLESEEADPQGPDSGTQRVNRGGSWYSQPDRCQTTNRSKDKPDGKLFNLGFRLVRAKDSGKSPNP